MRVKRDAFVLAKLLLGLAVPMTGICLVAGVAPGGGFHQANLRLAGVLAAWPRVVLLGQC